MRAITLAAALLALPAAAAAQDPGAPLPLRPAGVALIIMEEPSCTVLPGGGTTCGQPRLVLPELRPCTPRRDGVVGCEEDRARTDAALAVAARGTALPLPGGRGPELLSIDGVDLRGWSAERAGALLLGTAGTRATIVWRDDAGTTHTMVRTRTDVFAPGPGFSRLLQTRHFVIHFRPAEAGRARRLAERAERMYAQTGYPADAAGRRAHFWVVPYGGIRSKRGRVQPEVWGNWITGKSSADHELGRPLTYVGYGLPGRAAQELGAHVGWAPVQAAHRWAVRYLIEGSNAAGLTGFFDSKGELSLREYVRGRYGDAALGRLWRSDLPFDQAVPAVLGVDATELRAEWRQAILALGPNPDLAPRPGALAATIAWGALILLGGIAVARRREVG